MPTKKISATKPKINACVSTTQKKKFAPALIFRWYWNMATRQNKSILKWPLSIVYLMYFQTLFPHADQVAKLTVFNIAGNKVRLIAAIHYNSHKVYIRNVLTHDEYDKNKWKE
jgi:hypothetical protein